MAIGGLKSQTYYASVHKSLHSRAGLEDGNEKVTCITLWMEAIGIPTFYNHWPDLFHAHINVGNILVTWIQPIIHPPNNFEVLLEIHGKLCVSFNLWNDGKQHHHWVILGNGGAGPTGVLPHI